MLLQQSQPQSTREDTLSSFANHLQQLSAHLDARALAIQSSEARLASSQSDLSTHRHALNQFESRTRHQIAQLLRHVHQRQAALVSWERTAASAKRALSKTVITIDTLLAEARSATINLTQTKDENERVAASLIEHEARLSEIQAQIRAAKESHRNLKGTVELIRTDKETIQRSADRLQSLEAVLRSRESDLDVRAKNMGEQKEQLQHLRGLEALKAPLQAFLDSASAASLVEHVYVENDLSKAVEKAIFAMAKLQSATQEVQTARSNVSSIRQRIAARESQLRREESGRRAKEQSLEREKATLKLRTSQVSATQHEIDASWGAIEEARKEIESRDETLRTRETAAELDETRIQLRAKSLEEREKTLARRERSIRRAHKAVLAQERSFEAKNRQLEIERSRLGDLKKAIDVKEQMLETRDFELSTRDAEREKRLEGLLLQSLEHPIPVETARNGKPSQVPSAKKTRNESSNGRIDPEKSPDDDRADETSLTIRRKLAFFNSSKEGGHEIADDASRELKEDTLNEAQEGADQNISDDGSEAAAEQLLPELLGARSYWRDRVERLECIVESMSNKTWITKPHVLPVLASVAEGLSTIRREIDHIPQQSPNMGSPKNAYLSEQACQIQWREKMKSYFDSVREIQAGLLIQLNREEDTVVGSVDGERSQGAQSVETNNTMESSVEATLDVTLTGSLTRDMVQRSVQQPSSHAIAEGAVERFEDRNTASPLWDDWGHIYGASDNPMSSAKAGKGNDDRNREESPKESECKSMQAKSESDPLAQGNDAYSGRNSQREDLRRELTLLRDDLASVTVLNDAEIE